MMKTTINFLLVMCAFMLMQINRLYAQVTYPIEINATNFPDIQFQSFIRSNTSINKNQNNKLEQAEIEGCKSISIPANKAKNITNLKGIEFFTNLTYIGLHNPSITSIDLSFATELNTLVILKSLLTDIDLNSCTKLINVNLNDNYFLQNLYVSSLVNLEKLELDCCNELRSLSLSNPKLNYLSCKLSNLTSLDLNCENLRSIDCSNNPLSYLDLSQCPSLATLNCMFCMLKDLDLSKNSNLSRVILNYQYLDVEPEVRGNLRDSICLPFQNYTLDQLSRVSNCRLQDGFLPFQESQDVSYFLADNGMPYIELLSSWSTDINHRGLTLEPSQQNKGIFSYFITPIYHPNVSESVKSSNLDVNLLIKPFFALYLNPATNMNGNNRDNVYVGTLYAGGFYDMKIPTESGVKVYAATNITTESEQQGRLILEQKTGLLPPESGVLVTANESGLHLFIENTDYSPYAIQNTHYHQYWKNYPVSENYSPNIIKGTNKSEGLSVTPFSVLTLGRRTDDKSGLIGFWNYSGNKINQYRCYVPADQIPSSMQSPKLRGLRMDFYDEDGSVTSIETTPAMDGGFISTPENSIYYDLQGRRVTNPQRGGMYIVNGKKIIL